MKKLVLFSLFLVVVVIVLGVYICLIDVGLGCFDWSGCYGYLIVLILEVKIDVVN